MPECCFLCIVMQQASASGRKRRMTACEPTALSFPQRHHHFAPSVRAIGGARRFFVRGLRLQGRLPFRQAHAPRHDGSMSSDHGISAGCGAVHAAGIVDAAAIRCIFLTARTRAVPAAAAAALAASDRI